jgi:hypothetical protein
MGMLLAVIILWLTANFELPATDQHPNVEFASPQAIAAIRYQSLLAASGPQIDRTWALHEEQNDQSQIVAIYVDETETIYLPLAWTGRTPEELSVLVHETVHHLQNLGAMKHACAQEREKLAFAAQEKWLNMFGGSLSAAFGIDQLTLLVRTNCMF